MPKFPIPLRERKEFALKYGETLVTLLKKYLQRRLPQEWTFEIEYNPDQSPRDREEISLKIYTKTSEGLYSNTLRLPFMVYIPSNIYVFIPNFNQLEEEILRFIHNSVIDSVRPLKKSVPPENFQQKGVLSKLDFLRFLRRKIL
ncbi:hypothetical protein [Candidatus Hecatella orcuttiae]|uniref:hypothetical protein n=1 Tax=Candidatus Hecatella orcuttiae TaxID=1935119 RepID=UPI002867B93E|nr:hypothetical protein [Candidatus Hecatella orcuttiae]